LLFSSAGQIYADRRSNLLGENAEKLPFLSYNIRLFGFNYTYFRLQASECMFDNDSPF